MLKRRQWIKIAENVILFSVLYLIFWCHFFLFPGSEHGVEREFFICEDAAFVTPVCPRLVFGNAVPAHLVKYSLSGIGRFDKILPCPQGDEQEQRLSSASIKFLMWNIYEIIHIWSAGEDESKEWSSQWISNLSNPSYQISVA